MLRAALLCVAAVVVGCSNASGGAVDAGDGDARSIDAQVLDGAVVDGSSPDALMSDALTTDASGPDALPLACPNETTYVGRLMASDNEEIVELTLSGTELDRFTVPAGGPMGDVDDDIRDLAVDACGGLYGYQGTFAAAMAVRPPAVAGWTYYTDTGFNTVNNVSFGGAAVNDEYVYATDTRIAADNTRGVARFRISDGDVTRFADAIDSIDLTLGLDGLLYVLDDDGTSVSMFDPITTAAAGTLTLGTGVRAIAATAAGVVYGASWDGNLYQFSNAGAVTATLVTGANNLVDIDIAPDGTVAASGRFGDVILTDLSIAASTDFTISTTTVFVAFTASGTQ